MLQIVRVEIVTKLFLKGERHRSSPIRFDSYPLSFGHYYESHCSKNHFQNVQSCHEKLIFNDDETRKFDLTCKKIGE